MEEQIKVIFIPSGIRAGAEDGERVYDVALRAGVDIQSICGGKGLCNRCQFELEPGKHAKFRVDVLDNALSPLTPTEKRARAHHNLSDTRRLACRARLKGDAVIHIPDDAREYATEIRKKSTVINTKLNPSSALYMVRLPTPTLEDNPCDSEVLCAELAKFGLLVKPTHLVLTKLQTILEKNDRQVIAVIRDREWIVDVWPPSTSSHIYGAALDIGSTSIALYIYDLTTGILVHEESVMNPQIRYGEDLMSRVSYIMLNKGGDRLLTKTIREKVAAMLAGSFTSLQIETEQLIEIVIVGNPIMHHLFLGISPTPLGQAPFTLAIRDWFEAPAGNFDLGLSTAARISCLPLIGGHVGADTTGAYLTQIDFMKEKSVLLVDIGTNAEIMLSHGHRVAATSSPTGPAFEGAEISAGVRASQGAIERVRIDQKTKNPSFKIIGHDEWLFDSSGDPLIDRVSGICGSGIFEVMVELANAGLIDQGGLFIPEAAPERFIQEGKSWKYLLVKRAEQPLYIKQTDIRAVQLAKAALSAGVSLLVDHLECPYFDAVLLAGAFGSYLDPDYVAAIGIIPNVTAERIRSIGNAAGMGAAMALNNVDEKTRIIEAVRQIEKIETATEAKFQDYFIDAMKFPTAPKVQEGRGHGQQRRRRR